ncbi:xanthine dehydrogenase accessory factor [Clostridium polyendosporum]|uniref:Xanthine dehydrogenase accessory factor n=1 Tax=Clostridium polyendosporum TaxID=69208 RepID=A0A919VGZ3_9CLOT|nr:XdhC/CoxI family protein [Clostridium polyendosporum]GIM29702.1 xanthine dehydrogenase accessory factor [Clostridium polyendosporum]
MEELILKEIYKSLTEGLSVALVTITESIGSTPRNSGSIMAVWEDGTIKGSVGGGSIEYKIIEKAKNCLVNKEDSNFHYILNENGDIGMQCGGAARGYIKVFLPRNKLLIIGGGHIGEQLYKLGKIIGFYTVIFDDRQEYANEKIYSEADEIIYGDIEEKLARYPVDESCYIVVVSRGHESDLKAVRSVVGRSGAYLGMIGSARKTQIVINKLLEEGISKEELEKVYAPIGLDISSEVPEEIALAIISEILLVKNNGTLNHRKDIKRVKI